MTGQSCALRYKWFTPDVNEREIVVRWESRIYASYRPWLKKKPYLVFSKNQYVSQKNILLTRQALVADYNISILYNHGTP